MIDTRKRVNVLGITNEDICLQGYLSQNGTFPKAAAHEAIMAL